MTDVSRLVPAPVLQAVVDRYSTRLPRAGDYTAKGRPILGWHIIGTAEEIAEQAILALYTLSDAEKISLIESLLPEGYNIGGYPEVLPFVPHKSE